MSKRTYQPSKRCRKRQFGFRARMAPRTERTSSAAAALKAASACFPREPKSSTSATPSSTAVNPAARIRLTPPWNFFSRADPREMRLTRQQSMTRAFQFARVRNEGPSVAGRLIVLSATPLEHPEEPSKFGIICTKKIGCAVVRNKLRRRVREILRAHGAPFENGVHLVCVLRWRAVEASYADLERDWRKAARKLKLQLLSREQDKT